tara:strand:+ start:937 stop:1356 length:420 start_codon:yes stop_codon:yes gene_type:complete
MKMVSTRWAFFFLFCYALILGHNIIPHCHHSEINHFFTKNHEEHQHDGALHGHENSDFWSVLISVLSESKIHDNQDQFQHLAVQDTSPKYSNHHLAFLFPHDFEVLNQVQLSGFVLSEIHFVHSAFRTQNLKDRAPPIC